MTDFADLKAQIADWANRADWSDTLVTSFVRMAESKFNQDLRIDRMIQTNDALITGSCAKLPDDWIEFDMVMMSSPYTASGFIPISYIARDEFFRLPTQPYTSYAPSSALSSMNKYTIEGRTIYVGGMPDDVNGRTLRIHYYAEVPVFSDSQDSWVYDKYPALYLYASLMHADLHAVGEEDKAVMLNGLVKQMIDTLNADHLRARASGQRVSKLRRRSFG